MGERDKNVINLLKTSRDHKKRPLLKTTKPLHLLNTPPIYSLYQELDLYDYFHKNNSNLTSLNIPSQSVLWIKISFSDPQNTHPPLTTTRKAHKPVNQAPYFFSLVIFAFLITSVKTPTLKKIPSQTRT